MKFKGISVCTHISRRPKNGIEKNVCTNCKTFEKIHQNKNIDKEQEYKLCKGCSKCYVSKIIKAALITGRDQTTGKTGRKFFSRKN